jgi:hypothetical protein
MGTPADPKKLQHRLVVLQSQECLIACRHVSTDV